MLFIDLCLLVYICLLHRHWSKVLNRRLRIIKRPLIYFFGMDHKINILLKINTFLGPLHYFDVPAAVLLLSGEEWICAW